LTLATAGLTSQANTGLPVFKIGLESVVGSLAGGGATIGVLYAAYGINGGTNEPSVRKVGPPRRPPSPLHSWLIKQCIALTDSCRLPACCRRLC
jgi:hypothetical protein